MTFNIGTLELEYEVSTGHNNPSCNERTVEVALGRWFLNQPCTSPNCALEVGCVMPHYMSSKHQVIDLFEDPDMAEKADARTYDYRGRDVLSISTLEHIGAVANTDHPAQGTQHQAWQLLNKIRGEAGKYLITIPMGTHACLDIVIRELMKMGKQYVVMVRVGGDDNVWQEYSNGTPWIPLYDAWQRDYGHRTYLCVVTNIKEILGG